MFQVSHVPYLNGFSVGHSMKGKITALLVLSDTPMIHNVHVLVLPDTTMIHNMVGSRLT